MYMKKTIVELEERSLFRGSKEDLEKMLEGDELLVYSIKIDREEEGTISGAKWVCVQTDYWLICNFVVKFCGEDIENIYTVGEKEITKGKLKGIIDLIASTMYNNRF